MNILYELKVAKPLFWITTKLASPWNLISEVILYNGLNHWRVHLLTRLYSLIRINFGLKSKTNYTLPIQYFDDHEAWGHLKQIFWKLWFHNYNCFIICLVLLIILSLNYIDKSIDCLDWLSKLILLVFINSNHFTVKIAIK